MQDKVGRSRSKLSVEKMMKSLRSWEVERKRVRKEEEIGECVQSLCGLIWTFE